MKEDAYKNAGVDIEAAAGVVEKIKPKIRETARPGVMSGIGGFGALFDLKETGYKDPVLVSATDGVGTKIKIAIEMDRHDMIGIDAVAMCVNDIVVQGAEPLFFLDYFATGKLIQSMAETVIGSVAEGCAMAGCALIGGETAEMPGLYAPGDYDLAGFAVGAVERDRIITGEHIKPGDAILGLASNGIHSNGFSLVRKLIKTTQGFTYESPAPFEPSLSLGDILLTPTRIYVKALLAALQKKAQDGKPLIKGMAHITGGGLYENIPRILPAGTAAHLDATTWRFSPVFSWLKNIGALGSREMATTLNCGIGMVVICAPENVETLTETLKSEGETVYQIGEIIKKATDSVVIEHTEDAWH